MSVDKKATKPLKYIGGGHFIPGLPMRDLTAEEVDKLGGEAGLVATSLYAPFAKGEEPVGPPSAPVAATVADLMDSENDAGSMKKGG